MCRTTIVSHQEVIDDLPSRCCIPQLVCTVRTSQKPAGVTLHDGVNGLRVGTLHREDAAARAGLRRGDVILRMNGISCVKSAHGTNLLDTAHQYGLDVRCDVRRGVSWYS